MLAQIMISNRTRGSQLIMGNWIHYQNSITFSRGQWDYSTSKPRARRVFWIEYHPLYLSKKQNHKRIYE